MDTELFRRIWQTHIENHEHGGHPTVSEMYDFLITGNLSDGNSILAHLSRCSVCRAEFHKMLEALKETEALDIALPQLAGTKNIGGFLKIDTEGGKYTIIIQRSLKEKDIGMITVEVAENYREKLEGDAIILEDRKGRKLLEGTIVNGQVSQKVRDLENIDIQRFKIRRR